MRHESKNASGVRVTFRNFLVICQFLFSRISTSAQNSSPPKKAEPCQVFPFVLQLTIQSEKLLNEYFNSPNSGHLVKEETAFQAIV